MIPWDGEMFTCSYKLGVEAFVAIQCGVVDVRVDFRGTRCLFSNL